MAMDPIDIRKRLRRGAQSDVLAAAPTPVTEAPPAAAKGAKGGKPKAEVNKRMLLLALGTAAVASLMIVNYLRSSAGVLAEQSKLIKVPVLTQDVPRRSTLTESMITYKEIPALYVVEGTAPADAKLVGKIALADLYKGEPVMAKRVSDPNSDTGVAVKIPPGHRALAVANQLSGLVKPGDYVDVYATVRDHTGKSHTEPVLQRSLVLAVGSRINADATEDAGGFDAAKATIAVPDAKVHLMALMEEKGNFKLVLRAPDDTSKLPQKFTDQQMLTLLTGPAEAPKPSAPPPKPAPAKPVAQQPVYRPKPVERRVVVTQPAPAKPAAPRKDPVVVTVINGGNIQQQEK